MTDKHVSQSGIIEWNATPDDLGVPRDLTGRFGGVFRVEGTGPDAIITTDVGQNLAIVASSGTIIIGEAGPAEITTETGQDLSIAPDGDLILKSQTWPSVDGTIGQVLTTDGAGTLSWAAGGGGTAWWAYDYNVKSANWTAILGEYYFADIGTGVSITMSLPAAPTPGDRIGVRMTGAGTLVVDGGTENVDRYTTTIVLEEAEREVGVSLVYVNASLGWTVYENVYRVFPV